MRFPGTINERPQLEDTKTPAIKDPEIKAICKWNHQINDKKNVDGSSKSYPYTRPHDFWILIQMKIMYVYIKIFFYLGDFEGYLKS